jgi:hypothetical protein
VPALKRLILATLISIAAIGASATTARSQGAAPAAQTTPIPQASAAASPGSASDPSTLTPAQQAALQAAIIKTSQNPVGNIAIIPFQNNFNYGVGPYTRFQYNLNVQPVVPFMLSKNLTLIARTIIPIINQPSFAPPTVCASQYGCGSTFGLGDIQEQLFFAPKTQPGALIWGVGPILQVPSASPGALGAGKWAIGPNAVALVMPGNIVTGILVSQLWSVAGQANRPNLSSALFQPFFNYNLKDGWALSTAPVITANWTATQNKWAIPLGGGVAKTFKLGDQLMSVSALYYTYVARPITSPQTNLKVVWSLLFPIKRGIDIQELIKQSQ